jgi:DNA-binding PucR family transcriptional regulator
MPAAWDPPSPPVAELIRAIASVLLEAPEELFEEIEEALTVLADPQDPVVTDPTLAAAIRRNNRAGLVHWASANVSDPGAPVAPNLGPEALAVARDAVRRGFDQGILEGYRVGQNIAWQRWMTAAFQTTSDPEQLRELLDVSARSIFTYVDETLAGMAREIEREREELRRGAQAHRLEVVSLILEGAPIGAHRASVRLNYELDRSHTAAVVWTDAAASDPVALERAAAAIGRAAGALPLMVVASESSLWVWVASEDRPDLAALDAELAGLPGVRVALGPPAAGMAGFRRSHLDALATQRLLDRASSSLRLATYDDVQVVALTMHDEERATQFVQRTLGEFASAPAELRETARVYLREQSNASRTARVLFTHRNTVLARLARMAELLPAPLEGRVLQVALALEIVHWMGPPAAAP